MLSSERREELTVSSLDATTRAALIRLATDVQRLPYAWPAPPTAAAAREAGAGTCASKHALLAEEAAGLGLSSAPLLLVGPLVPPALRGDGGPLDAAGDLLEVHECIVILTPWAGPLRVDITWDPPLLDRGFGGPRDWDGASDTPLAIDPIGPGWSVPRDQLRAAKEGLRGRLYGAGDRARRDAALAALSTVFAAWRAERTGAPR
jgi:hypothetical protein